MCAVIFTVASNAFQWIINVHVYYRLEAMAYVKWQAIVWLRLFTFDSVSMVGSMDFIYEIVCARHSLSQYIPHLNQSARSKPTNTNTHANAQNQNVTINPNLLKSKTFFLTKSRVSFSLACDFCNFLVCVCRSPTHIMIRLTTKRGCWNFQLHTGSLFGTSTSSHWLIHLLWQDM